MKSLNLLEFGKKFGYTEPSKETAPFVLQVKEPLIHRKPDMNVLAGGFEPAKEIVPKLEGNRANIRMIDDNIRIIENALTHTDTTNLIGLMNQSNNFEGVSVQGIKGCTEIGSVRTSIWSEQLAKEFDRIILPFLPKQYTFNEFYPTDFHQNNGGVNWKPIGISPLLRFMRYKAGGQHYTHYDAGFFYTDKIRTLFSVVVYLTTNKNGCTRFIHDTQSSIPTSKRNHDTKITNKPEEIYFSSRPIAGNILIFPHRLPHDVELYTGDNDRIIIRGDVICENV